MLLSLKKHISRRFALRATLLAAFTALVLLTYPSQPARAYCSGSCGSCVVIVIGHLLIQQISIPQAHILTRQHITDEFTDYETWLVRDFWLEHVLPAMKTMTENLANSAMMEMVALGAILDAKHQLETERLFQQMAAEAHRNLHSDVNMCAIGTVARGMAAADRNAEYNAIFLTQQSLNRQLGSSNGSAAEGREVDRTNRLDQFRQRYCDPSENNNGLGTACGVGGDDERINKDVDYARMLGAPKTLDVDFSNPDMTKDEEDLIAFTSNIFSHDVIERPGESSHSANTNKDDFLESRAVAAKRSVAESSFYTIAGMKSAGGEGGDTTGPFVAAIMQQFGVGAGEAAQLVGERPSYYALLEAISQKIYQDPEFFTNLYDKPSTIARRDVAMQAIDIMLDRDSYKSELRYEALLTTLLELEATKNQKATQNRLNWLNENDKEVQ